MPLGALDLSLVPVQMDFYQIDPIHGDYCNFNKEDAWSLDGRVLAHHPVASSYLMGSDLGRLSSQWSAFGNCGEEWSASPLEVGSVLQFTLPTELDALPGPTVVQAQLGVEVDGLDEVQLNLLGHSYRSRYGMPTSMVHFNVHIQYWLPPVYMDTGPPKELT